MILFTKLIHDKLYPLSQRPQHNMLPVHTSTNAEFVIDSFPLHSTAVRDFDFSRMMSKF